MMHCEQQHMLGWRQPYQGGSNQWASDQIKGTDRILFGQSDRCGLVIVLRSVLEVDDRQRQREFRHDHLKRLRIYDDKDRAQAFVPPDDLVEAALDRRYVKGTTEAHSSGDGIRGAIGIELGEKP